VGILPFMVSGRDKPNPQLGGLGLHHRLLSSADVAVNAQAIAEGVIGALDETLRAR
jgi:hypothetical protein